MAVFRCGEIYQIQDNKVNFVGNENRTVATGLKRSRFVLIVEESELLENDQHSAIVVAPFSTSPAKATYDLPFQCGEGNLTQNCYCCLGHIQAIDKRYLKTEITSIAVGRISAARIEEVKINLIDMLGLSNYI